MSGADAKRSDPLHEFVIPSELKRAKGVERVILARIRDCGYGEDFSFAIKLALEESLTNAIKHGNQNDQSKTITVQYSVDEHRVIIVVTDEGRGFCPDDVPDPTTDENLQRPCGRGIMLMRAYMSDVEYNERGNQVRMVKVRES